MVQISRGQAEDTNDNANGLCGAGSGGTDPANGLLWSAFHSSGRARLAGVLGGPFCNLGNLRFQLGPDAHGYGMHYLDGK